MVDICRIFEFCDLDVELEEKNIACSRWKSDVLFILEVDETPTSYQKVKERERAGTLKGGRNFHICML